MLEIIILFRLCGSIGRVMEQKGHKPGWYKLMLVLFWFGGELSGALIAAAASALAIRNERASMSLIYLCALLRAALGAFLAFAIARSVPPAQNEVWEEVQPLSTDEEAGQDRVPEPDAGHFYDPQTRPRRPFPDAFESDHRDRQ
jgi:hypothetical protein